MHDTSIDCDFTSELLRVGFQLILPSKYIIDVDQIIRARGEGVNKSQSMDVSCMSRFSLKYSNDYNSGV